MSFAEILPQHYRYNIRFSSALSANRFTQNYDDVYLLDLLESLRYFSVLNQSLKLFVINFLQF